MIEDKNIHKGHRSRMRAKLAAHGPRIFDTYELLEMLLYYAVPYKDTNPVAKRLLSTFGSLDGVLRASKEELMAHEGIGEKCAELIIRTGAIMAENDSMSFGCDVDIFDNYNFAGAYLADYFSKSDSRICMAMLDNAMRLIGIKDIPGKDFSSGAVKPKYFIDPALKADASIVILAHVHEHGALFPSEGDMASDKLIRAELNKVGILVAEHYIIGGPHYVGLKVGLSIRVSAVSAGLERFYNSIPLMAGAGTLAVGDFKRSRSKPYCYADENPLCALLALVMGEEKAKAASDTLLTRYGRFSTVLSENEEELSEIEGMGMNSALFIKLVGYLNSRRVTDSLVLGKKYETAYILEYMIALYIGLSVETIYMLSFDDKSRFISCDFMGEGTVVGADVYPRKLLETALKKKATSVILVHNHPKGNASPSRDDESSMRSLVSVFYGAGIRLKAHYVVADGAIGKIESEFVF